MAEGVTMHITELTTVLGKTKGFKLNVDGQSIMIQVDEALFSHYQNQFYREKPSALQKKKLQTLSNLMRAAYAQGLKDGKK